LLERIKKISPNKDHKILDELIDIQFIQQTIQNGLIDAKGFYGIFHGIWSQLRKLHAPIHDSSWDNWHNSILEQMQSQDATWSKLLPQVFNTFFIKLDQIEESLQQFRQLTDNIINKNKE